MNVKIRHSSVRLRICNRTAVKWKCSVAFLHSLLVTIEGFGLPHVSALPINANERWMCSLHNSVLPLQWLQFSTIVLCGKNARWHSSCNVLVAWKHTCQSTWTNDGRVLPMTQCYYCGGWNFLLQSSVLLQNSWKFGSLIWNKLYGSGITLQFE